MRLARTLARARWTSRTVVLAHSGPNATDVVQKITQQQAENRYRECNGEPCQPNPFLNETGKFQSPGRPLLKD